MPTPRRHANPAERQAAYRRRCAAARSKELEAKGMPALPAITSLPGQVRWQALVQQANLLLQTAHAEMEEYYDQRRDTWRDSERGDAFLERLQALEETRSAVEDLGS